MLVVMHHCAIVYGGAGSWYWRETPEASSLLLVSMNAVDQAFFMGFFFLLAGYLTPDAVRRKGWGNHWRDRLIRLGIPLTLYFFLVSPFTAAIATRSAGESLASHYWRLLRESDARGVGPLWFCEALLLFLGVFAIWQRLGFSCNAPKFPSRRTLVLWALALGGGAFLLRLFVPVGMNVLGLQLGYFPCYAALFLAGCAASEHRLLEGICGRTALGWTLVSSVMLLALQLVLATRLEAGGFGGGLNFNALFYAFWDPFMAIGLLLGLLFLSQRLGETGASTSKWLGQAAYPAFFIHAPILVALSRQAAAWQAAPLLKFATVGTMATGLSFAAGAAIRAIPGTRKIF